MCNMIKLIQGMGLVYYDVSIKKPTQYVRFHVIMTMSCSL